MIGLLLIFLGLTLPRIPHVALKSDASLATYISQRIADGAAPYADYVIMHPPAAHLIGAAAIWIGRWVGLDAALSIRALCLIAALTAISVSYSVGRAFDRRIGVLTAGGTAGVMLMQITFAGVHVRSLLILFLLLWLICLQRQRWSWAGLGLAFAMMTWAGAASFMLITGLVLVVSRPRSWNSGRDLLLGWVLGVALIIACVALMGGFTYFWQQYVLTVPEYALNKLVGQAVRDEAQGIANLLDRTTLSLPDLVVGMIAAVGAVIFVLWRGRKAIHQPAQSPLLFALAVGIVMIFVDYQSAYDLVPLIPSAAALWGWTIAEGMQRWVHLWALADTPFIRTTYAAIVLIGLSLVRGAALPHATDELTWQREAAAWLQSALPDNTSIQALGDLSMLVLADQQNASRIIHLGPKSLLAMQNEGLSLQTWEDDLKADPPLLILIDVRNMREDYLSEFVDWISLTYLLIGYTHESSLLIYAQRGSADALTAGAGLLLFEHDLSDRTLRLKEWQSRPNPVSIPLSPQTLLTGYQIEQDTVHLHWWVAENNSINGHVGLRWLDSKGQPLTGWVVNAVEWGVTLPSRSEHRISQPLGIRVLEICIMELPESCAYSPVQLP